MSVWYHIHPGLVHSSSRTRSQLIQDSFTAPYFAGLTMEIWQILLAAVLFPLFMFLVLFVKLKLERDELQEMSKTFKNQKNKKATVFISADEYEELKSAADKPFEDYLKSKEE